MSEQEKPATGGPLDPDGLTPLERHDRDFESHVRHASFRNAHLAGFGTAFLAAWLWGLSTYYTHLVFPILAIPLSILVGVFVRRFGAGSGAVYGIIGGKYALLGSLAGQFSSILFYIASVQKLPIFSVLVGVDYAAVLDIFWEMFDVMAWGVYTVSFVAAYRIAVNPMAKDELDYLLEAKGVDRENARYGQGYFRRNQRLSDRAKGNKTGLTDILGHQGDLD